MLQLPSFGAPGCGILLGGNVADDDGEALEFVQLPFAGAHVAPGEQLGLGAESAERRASA